jgi:hypothetical protein
MSVSILCYILFTQFGGREAESDYGKIFTSFICCPEKVIAQNGGA